jgi:hypothetical protein
LSLLILGPPKGKEKRAIYSCDVRVFMANFCLTCYFLVARKFKFSEAVKSNFSASGQFSPDPSGSS